MTVRRPVQTSLIEGMERPVGPVLSSVFQGSNSDLMSAVAGLYLTGSVLDVTYGDGKWWQRFTPAPFAHHDLKTDGVDFRQLPERDSEYETVTFDPPYVISGGNSTGSMTDNVFQDSYGIGCRNLDEPLDSLILKGLAESCRVASSWVLVKCMEFAQGGAFHDVPHMVTNAAAALGWYKHDQIVHYTGTGPGGHNIFEVRRARRAHSYLLVFGRVAGSRHYG